MERPSSRGLLSNASIGKSGAPPPGTAMGRGGAPPSTAYKRTGTASGNRPGTGSQGGPAAGARTGTAVQVDARPITQHGVSGMKTAAAGGGGGGRKVLDKNYFLTELRQKRSEIANVTQSMQVCSRPWCCDISDEFKELTPGT